MLRQAQHPKRKEATMVTKTEEGFAVHVSTGTHPASDYVETMNDLVSALQGQDEDMLQKNYHLLQLLREMLPTFEQAKAMFDEIKDL